VNVGQRPEHLISIQLDEELGYALLHLHVVSHDSVHGFRDVIHNYVEVDLILLVSSSVEGMLHCDNVWMEELLHNLKLSVFIALVLVDLLDGDCFASFSDSGLVYHSK
jgi:hypothetical protein